MANIQGGEVNSAQGGGGKSQGAPCTTTIAKVTLPLRHIVNWHNSDQRALESTQSESRHCPQIEKSIEREVWYERAIAPTTHRVKINIPMESNQRNP